jgi:hypothetical protein
VGYFRCYQVICLWGGVKISHNNSKVVSLWAEKRKWVSCNKNQRDCRHVHYTKSQSSTARAFQKMKNSSYFIQRDISWSYRNHPPPPSLVHIPNQTNVRQYIIIFVVVPSNITHHLRSGLLSDFVSHDFPITVFCTSVTVPISSLVYCRNEIDKFLTKLWFRIINLRFIIRLECAVDGVRHPQHTQTGSNSFTIAADSSNGVTNTRCCRYSFMRSWWWVEVPPETCIAVSRYK